MARPAKNRLPPSHRMLLFARQAPPWVVSQFEKMRKRRVIITFHSLGDLDAGAAALALAEELGPLALIAPPDSLNSESRRVLGEPVRKWPRFFEARSKYPDAPVILLDANDPSILPQFRTGGPKIELLIDHHAMQKDSVRAKTVWLDADASSVCELAAHLIEQPSCEQAEWLVLGMLSDSARLIRADAETFATLSRLLAHSARSYEQLLAALERPEPAAGRAAVLEGLRAVTWKEEGGLLAACAAVSSHESHVAEVLQRAGADAAFAGSASGKGGARISARLRPSLASRIDLPALMNEVGQSIGGSGGGHPAAAGASGRDGSKLNEALLLAQQKFFRQIRNA